MGNGLGELDRGRRPTDIGMCNLFRIVEAP